MVIRNSEFQSDSSSVLYLPTLKTFVDVNTTPNPDDPDITEPLPARFPHAEATGVAAPWGCCCCWIGGPVVVVVVVADASVPHTLRGVAGGTAEVPDAEDDASGRDRVAGAAAAAGLLIPPCRPRNLDSVVHKYIKIQSSSFVEINHRNKIESSFLLK
jgi:hypothetical protein